MKKIVLIIVVMLFAVLFSVSGQVDAKPQTVYKNYVSMVTQPIQPYYGLAMAVPNNWDLLDLGVGWWYVWGPTGNVPMLWAGDYSSSIPSNYSGWILFLNEPNEDSQSDMSPSEAITKLIARKLDYPSAKFICCGISNNGALWHEVFYAIGGRPDAWSVHNYVSGTNPTAATLIAQNDYLHNITGGDYWITEYGSMNGVLSEFTQLTESYKQRSWIKRIAPYTNRQPHTGEPWELPSGVELYNYQTGVIKEIGSYYRSLANIAP